MKGTHVQQLGTRYMYLLDLTVGDFKSKKNCLLEIQTAPRKRKAMINLRTFFSPTRGY